MTAVFVAAVGVILAGALLASVAFLGSTLAVDAVLDLASAFFSSTLLGILPAVTGFWVVCCVLATLVLAVLGGGALSAGLFSTFFGSGFTGADFADADALLLTFSAGLLLALSAGLLAVVFALAGCALGLVLATAALFWLAAGVLTKAGALAGVGFTGAWLTCGVWGTR